MHCLKINCLWQLYILYNNEFKIVEKIFIYIGSLELRTKQYPIDFLMFKIDTTLNLIASSKY